MTKMIASAIAAFLFVSTASAQEFGSFSGDPVVTIVGPRDMILVEQYEYYDPEGRTWQVPNGYRSNGASIPKIFWSFTGGPWSGAYTNAAIVHDYFCEFIGPPSDEVHRMFYSAMRANGVPERKAWVMYQAVEVFGRNWEIVDQNVADECKPGPSFAPSQCVFNDTASIVDTTIEPTEARLEDFFDGLEAAGYASEVIELREAIAQTD